MFGKNNTKQTEPEVNTIIGEKTTFEGIITTETSLKIEGTMKGDIRSSGHVIIGTTGFVDGNINAGNLYVAGKINGDVNVQQKTQFVSGGYLHGNIISNDISMEIGSVIDGMCKTNNGMEGLEYKSLSQKNKELPTSEDKTIEV